MVPPRGVKCRINPLLFLSPNNCFEHTDPLSLSHKEGPIQNALKNDQRKKNLHKIILKYIIYVLTPEKMKSAESVQLYTIA